MSKISKDRENRHRDELEKMLDARDAVAMEVMQKLFERLPFGQKFTLSDGSVGCLRKLAEPQLCSNESSDHFERPHFGVDVKIEGGPVDFVEIHAYQTGSGMALGPAGAERRANANSPQANEAADAQTPDTPTNWAQSHGRETGRHSKSSPSQPGRRRGTGGNSPRR
jgi:hypothetical protein